MKIKQLIKYSLFHNLTESEVTKFLKIIANKKYESNEIIISENDIGDSVMLLLDGIITISKSLTIKIDQIEQPEKEFIKLNANQYPFFGEISLFNKNDKRTATITADTNCKIGVLYHKDILRIFDDHPNIGYLMIRNIAKKLSQDLNQTNKQILKLTTAFSLILDK